MESALKTCSFCSRPEQQAGRLIFGPNSAICHDCAATALEFTSEGTAPGTPPSVQPPVRRQSPHVDEPSHEKNWTSVFNAYLDDIPFISLGEERTVLQKDGLERVTRSYLPLVAVLASKYASPTVDPVDIIQETMVVLMKWIRSRQSSSDLSDILSILEAAARTAVGVNGRREGASPEGGE